MPAAGIWIKGPRGEAAQCCECKPTVCDPCVVCGTVLEDCVTMTVEPTDWSSTCGPASMVLFETTAGTTEGAAGTFQLYGGSGCTLQVLFGCSRFGTFFGDPCGATTCAVFGCQDRSRSLTVDGVTITPPNVTDSNTGTFCRENVCLGPAACCFNGSITVVLAASEVVDCEFSVSTGATPDNLFLLVLLVE